MGRLKCSHCYRHPPKGHGPEQAFEQIYWLGLAKFPNPRPPKRRVIHLVCGHRFWTNHPDVLKLDLFSLRLGNVVPRGTRLDEL